MEQYHLTGNHHSGRAVRVKSLDDIAVGENLTNAAKLISPDATGIELKKREWSLGVKLFVVQISDPCEDPFALSVKWKKVTPMDFDEGLKKYFTAKDVMFLEGLYRDYHDISQADMDKIVGKVKVVSED